MPASTAEVPVKPHSFLCVLQPKGHAGDASPHPVGLPFRLALETTEYHGEVVYAEREMLTTSADGSTFVLLGGTLYRPEHAQAGDAILALYQQRGADFVHDLNGRFALMLVDQREGHILFVTDRLNSIKLLTSQSAGALIVSNSADVHPTTGRPDSTAVASFLVAGFAYNNRTVFEGVSALPGASIYRPRGTTLEQQRYWQYQFSNPPNSPALAASLKAELEEAMVEAVRLRVKGDQPIYVSLTAGYDSRTVLGILAERLRVPDIRAFTYAYGDALPLSDEQLAPQIAAIAGVPHRRLTSVTHPLAPHLKSIARWSAGMADVSDELDAWQTLRQEVAPGPRPLLFTGDITIISSDSRLASVADVVTVARMPDFSAARWLEPLIGPPVYHEWVEATREDIERVVKTYPSTADYYDLRDMMRYDGRDSRVFAAWREYYTGRVFEVANPLTDERVMDVFMKMPTALRRSKTLYRETIYRMFPALFSVPYATSAGYATYWPAAFRQQAASLREWVREQPSPFDDILEPDVLLALIDSDLSAYARRYISFRAALKKAYRWLRSMTGSPPVFARPSLARPVTPAHRLLTRALMLRALFQSVQERQDSFKKLS